MKKIIPVFLMTLLVFGCKSLDKTLGDTTQTEEKLPALELVMDENSFTAVYPSVSYSSTYSVTDSSSDSDYSFTTTNGHNNTYGNRYVNEFNKIYEKQMYDYVCESFGENKGKMVLKLVDGSFDSDDTGAWGKLSACLLFIPNLFGMPFYYAKGSVQLRLMVYNKNNDLLGKYESELYSAKAKVGIGGYASDEDCDYAVTKDLFVKALNDIQKQVTNDTARLLPLFGVSSASAGAVVDDKIQKLKDLKQLFDDGVLDEEEFKKEKEKLLSK